MSTEDKELPRTIYLIQTGDEGAWCWCDQADPEYGLDADDAVEYVRSNIVSREDWQVVAAEYKKEVQHLRAEADALRLEITTLEQKLEEREWVSVDDRLPEDNAKVVVRMGGKHDYAEYGQCTYKGYFPFLSVNWEEPSQKCPVTHWILQPPQDTNNES